MVTAAQAAAMLSNEQLFKMTEDLFDEWLSDDGISDTRETYWTVLFLEEEKRELFERWVMGSGGGLVSPPPQV